MPLTGTIIEVSMGFLFILIFKLNNFSLPILLQDKYNIGVLTVNIEFMWLGTKRMERFAKAHLSPVSKPRHINSIFTANTPILFIYFSSLACICQYFCSYFVWIFMHVHVLLKKLLRFCLSLVWIRYDNVTLSPLLLPARVTNRSHSTYGSSARSDSHRAVFCPNSVVSGWKN